MRRHCSPPLILSGWETVQALLVADSRRRARILSRARKICTQPRVDDLQIPLVRRKQLFIRSAVLGGTSSTVGTFPGPLVGSTFFLNVADHLTDTTMLRSTSIHWHGMFQHGSSWADGPVGVTQCPIAPGNSFLNQFSVPDQAGTFWYHSHHSTQYCDGLRGALVVYDPYDPYRHLYDFDNESTVITLADWYHTPAPSAGLVPTADSTLINGKGRYSGRPTSSLSTINVQHSARYRFRLVSISCDPNFTFSIDGHNMTIIEVDGINVQPTTVDSIQIFAGQRYSFILTAGWPVANYWVRALPNLGPQGFSGGVNSAILRYSGAPNLDTTNQTTSVIPILETNLHPLSNPGAPGKRVAGGADVNINLNIALNFTEFLFTVNGATFQPPTVPILLQILSGAKTAQDLLPTGSVYTLPRNKVVALSLPGGAAGSPHPIHLHGTAFNVVRSAANSTYNYVNPVRPDVVSIGGAGDNVTIRFTTNNPGPWILHCHIDWHLNLYQIGGRVRSRRSVERYVTSTYPTAWDKLCPTYDALPTEFFT
ncbi:laccase, multicopper oxidase, benzenediol:oxygen oxidorectuctase [Laccaria bicolor S238N-H82]|uniref:Laccase, multicopper oxidase, benzenediol:oxygen oxidorectuctase n=2 Tax=Laccaria bicolor TaxID=29883 RepID=B0DUR0_LACBS|nr:laccase, multicopper oxidase, benzenediol:oxygen oxidorectuctase [Laccaria bicolor S238N-H82]ACN49092.1 laccase [Laccaria bicolor]EDR01587.1 laccase, multicopper oxidase, benzenediol:oxygen oxidorectuctase [Laccaria bicolor S238N-H82]|eukprot:XP_001887663.1 laccase, multicopper oxidase, benzenediol:oxygen oxidorectuctase [Laccaria bicolor S238N-H82]